MSDGVLEIREVKFSYPGGDPVMRGLSLQVPSGQSLGLVGANGAGKSTLLHLILGVLQPAEGEILYGGTAMTPKNLAEFRRNFGLVFQDPDDQLFLASIAEDVAFGPRNLGLDEAAIEARVAEALSLVGLEHLRARPSFKMSGGEKREAALASVLSMRPNVLVLDEPTASLDPGARRRIMRLLAGLPQTRIITSHDLDMVLEICGRVVVLKDGNIAADGPAKTVLSDARLLESCGLELPLTLQGCGVCGRKTL